MIRDIENIIIKFIIVKMNPNIERKIPKRNHPMLQKILMARHINWIFRAV